MSNLLPILLIVAAAVALLWVLSALDVWQRKGSAIPLRYQLAAWWYRVFHDPEPYDSSFAETPDHVADCAGRCCWETRLTEMVDAFDWNAAEEQMTPP